MRHMHACRELRAYVGLVTLAIAVSGCASSRGPMMTPMGPRWLGPADPIAAGRPPAITYDPYQPDGVPRPQGLARYFPTAGPVAPGVNRPPLAEPATTLAAATRPPRPTTLARREAPAIIPTLSTGITLETFPVPEGSSDPETRLASRRERVVPKVAAGSFDLADADADAVADLEIEAPAEVPDLNDGTPPEPADELLQKTPAPPKTRRPGWLRRLRNKFAR